VNFQTGPFGTQFSASEYTKEGIPVINVKDIGFGNILTANIEHVSEQTRDRLSQHILKEEDIVFGRKGSIDRHAFITNKETGWVQGSDCIRARAKTNIDMLFLSQYLESKHVKKQLMNSAVGSTMASLNTDILKDIVVFLPDISEQHKISRVLKTLDDKILLNNQINDNLGKQIETLYSYWFNQFNFPNENGAPYSDSNGFTKWNSHIKRQIPKSWEVKNIRDITNLTWGQCPQGEHIFPNNMTADNLFDYCSGAGDMNGGLLVDCQGKTDDSKRFAYPNDILISIAGKIGNMCLVDHKISLGRAALAFTAKDQEIIPYIYMTLKSLNKKIVTVSTGSIQKVISDTNVDDFNFPYSEEIVKKFCLCANPLFHKIIKLEQEKKELIRLRNWLLPMLMNGQAIIED
jgi:type I restriction enzyme S subunit